MKITIGVLIIALFVLMSGGCADEQSFYYRGINISAEPYGWANQEKKLNYVNYEVNVGNVVWDVLLFSSVLMPIWGTGWEFYEPVSLNKEKFDVYLLEKIKSGEFDGVGLKPTKAQREVDEYFNEKNNPDSDKYPKDTIFISN